MGRGGSFTLRSGEMRQLWIAFAFSLLHLGQVGLGICPLIIYIALSIPRTTTSKLPSSLNLTLPSTLNSTRAGGQACSQARFYPPDNIHDFPQELSIRSFFRNPVRVLIGSRLSSSTMILECFQWVSCLQLTKPPVYI